MIKLGGFLLLYVLLNPGRIMFCSFKKVQNLTKRVTDHQFLKLSKAANVFKTITISKAPKNPFSILHLGSRITLTNNEKKIYYKNN